MFAGEVGVEVGVGLDIPDCLLDVVVIGVHGVEFFIDHEVGGPEFVVDVLGIGLQFLYFWIIQEVLSSSLLRVC